MKMSKQVYNLKSIISFAFRRRAHRIEVLANQSANQAKDTVHHSIRAKGAGPEGERSMLSHLGRSSSMKWHLCWDLSALNSGIVVVIGGIGDCYPKFTARKLKL